MHGVLLLTAGYGEGHNAAARGLNAAFHELGAAADLHDVCAESGGVFYEQSRRGYLELINRAPQVWAAAYALVDQLPVVSTLLPLLRPVERALKELISERQPTAVISVYPLYGYLIARLFPTPQSRPFGFFTVVTDSITINRVWHRCGSDGYFVANEDTANVMRYAGVEPDRVHALGFPVLPDFADKRPFRRPPGIGERPRVLYMINSGKEVAPTMVNALLELGSVDLTVTVGRDEALRQRVAAAAACRPVEIHGWTERMPELLMSHHLLIGKAGGAAVQEAIAACTPMLITQVVPGQEEGNARLLVQHGCGAICETPGELAAAVHQLFAGEATEWQRWHGAICALSRPDAAREIARTILRMTSRC